MVEGEGEYEMEGILQYNGEGASHLYLVLWKGFPIIEASWVYMTSQTYCSSPRGILPLPLEDKRFETTGAIKIVYVKTVSLRICHESPKFFGMS